MPKLIFERDKEYVSMMRSYKILVNGSEIGSIKNGKRQEFEVEPSEYAIQMQIDWCKSKEIKVNIQPGETIRFRCGSRLKWWESSKGLQSDNPLDVFVYLDMVE